MTLIVVVLGVAAAGGWSSLGFAAIALAVTIVLGIGAGLLVSVRLRRSVLGRSWAWRWFETLTHTVHEDPSGRQVSNVLDVLRTAPPARIREVVLLTSLAFGLQMRDRIVRSSRTIDPHDIVAEIRRRAIAALGPQDDDPDFADEADVVLLRDIHTAGPDLDEDQIERLVAFIPLFAAVMCEDPAVDLGPLRVQVTEALRLLRRPRRQAATAATGSPTTS